MGIWGQEWGICEYGQIFSGWVRWCKEGMVLWAGHCPLCVGGGCQGGLSLISQSKAAFFG